MGSDDQEADDASDTAYENDYSGCNLIDEDFCGRNLSLADFTNARLNGANFTNATLRDSTFEDADCRGADFQRANLENAIFRNADLRNANLRARNLRGTVFEECLLNTDTEVGGIERTIGNDDDLDELSKISATYRKLHSLLIQNGRFRDANDFGYDYRAFEIEAERARRKENQRRLWKYRFYYYLYRYGAKPLTVGSLIGIGLLTIIVFGLLYPYLGIIEHNPSNTDHTFKNSSFNCGTLRHTSNFSLRKFAHGVFDILRIFLLPFVSLSSLKMVIQDYNPTGDAQLLATAEYAIGALLAVTLVLLITRTLSLYIRSGIESDKTTVFDWLLGQ